MYTEDYISLKEVVEATTYEQLKKGTTRTAKGKVATYFNVAGKDGEMADHIYQISFLIDPFVEESRRHVYAAVNKLYGWSWKGKYHITSKPNQESLFSIHIPNTLWDSSRAVIISGMFDLVESALSDDRSIFHISA